MEVNFVTHDELDAKLDDIIKLIDKKQVVKNRILKSPEIMRELQIKSRLTFDKRKPKLIKFGMYKEGKSYYMTEQNLQRYINSK